MECDAVYFRRRAQDERLAADKAGHETARRLHLEMADRYDELATAIDSRQPASDLRATA